MRVDAKDPSAPACLPVKLPLLPAIMVLSPHESPHVYEKMMHMTPTDLAEWLAEHIPVFPEDSPSIASKTLFVAGRFCFCCRRGRDIQH